MRRPTLPVLLSALAPLLGPTAAAQQGTLDLVDGETLYDGGWLVTAGGTVRRLQGLRSGTASASNPPALVPGRRLDAAAALGVHYGLRHDLQVGALLPWVRQTASGFTAGASTRTGEGVGDLELFGKWRFYRWDARGKALNVAAIAGLSIPTGSDEETAGGAELQPDLQPGSGTFDPRVGLAATYEPGRWRYNLGALYTLDVGTSDAVGDAFSLQAEVGNRFWLEPYPGPFMRLDGIVRWTHLGRDRFNGSKLPNTGGDRVSVGLNYAFRPRPSLDFQLAAELPVWQNLNGTQLGENWTLSATIGYRF